MFARVIPLLRTPSGVEAFDYRIPDGMKLSIGELVRVPFRGREIPALAEALTSQSAFAARAAAISDTYGEIVLPKTFVDFISWLAKEHFVSKPAALKSCLRQLPKRTHLFSFDFPSVDVDAELAAHWTTDAERQLIKAVNNRTGRRLILTPWKHRALAMQEHLPGSLVLQSDQAMGDYFKTWTSFLSSSNAVLITTRIGAWLAPLCNHVFIDEPENDDHKQDDLSPRFDARRVALWAHANAHVSVSSFGLTPPLHVSAKAPEISADIETAVRHPQSRSDVPMFEAETLNRLREHEGPLIVVHPIAGVRSRVVCRDCGWQALCGHCGFPLSEDASGAVCRVCKKLADTAQLCGHCGSADLGKSVPGLELIKRKMMEYEPQLKIDWRSTAVADLEKPIPQHSLLVLTMGALLGTIGAEDIRQNERLVIAYRRLAERMHQSQSTLLIQAPESFLPDWHGWLTSEGFESFRQNERKERALFSYPPANQLIKIIVTGNADSVSAWREKHEKHLEAFDVQGPFFVPYLPQTRAPRAVFHLRAKSKLEREHIIRLLTPLAKSAIIDLDPIAFFR